MTLKAVPVPEPDEELIADVMQFIRKYVVMSDAQALVCTLFVVHTGLVELCEQTPYLFISSPERGCGKSRLMEVLELLVARAWSVTSPSAPVLFRKVHAEMPTLLWDEIDTVFSPVAARTHEEHRALLDQGHRKFGRVPRFIGDKTVEFNVYGAKVFAGIGTLPDTISSRSIPIRLQRRNKNTEPVARLRRRDVKPTADKLRERIAAWTTERGKEVSAARPDMPDELDDRMQEGCESLVAIADMFGDEMSAAARKALVELLVVVDRVDSTDTMRLRLLRDIRQVFAEEAEGRGGRMPRAVWTDTLIEKLITMDEAPWARYYSRGIEANDIASLLRHFGIRSAQIKHAKQNRHGYHGDLAAVWDRYLPDEYWHAIRLLNEMESEGWPGKTKEVLARAAPPNGSVNVSKFAAIAAIEYALWNEEEPE